MSARLSQVSEVVTASEDEEGTPMHEECGTGHLLARIRKNGGKCLSLVRSWCILVLGLV